MSYSDEIFILLTLKRYSETSSRLKEVYDDKDGYVE